MIVVTVKVQVEHSRQQALVDRYNQVSHQELSSKGCIDYRLYQDPGSNDQFFFYEAWENQQSFDEHVARAPLESFVDCIVSANIYHAEKIEA